jgi:hypothetical protein
MAIDNYLDILKRARDELSPEEQHRLVNELSRYASQTQIGQEHKITDLKGLGKEVWNGIDPDEFIAEERDSWD